MFGCVLKFLWICSLGCGVFSLIVSDPLLMWLFRIIAGLSALLAINTYFTWPSRAEAKAPGVRKGSSMRERWEGGYGDMRRTDLNVSVVPYKVAPNMKLAPAPDADAGWETVAFTIKAIVVIAAVVWFATVLL